MNLPLLGLSLIMALPLGFLLRYQVRSFVEFLDLLRKIEAEGKFVFSKRGTGTASFYLVSEKLDHEEVCGTSAIRGIFLFNKYLTVAVSLFGIGFLAVLVLAFLYAGLRLGLGV